MPVTDIHALRLLPPLAIARLGSSPSPMDNYDVITDDAAGFRRLVPAPTFHIHPATGEILNSVAPATVTFRDADKRIRPVAPFFELWAQFTSDGPLQPLTMPHLQELALQPSQITWRVRVGNLKAYRRTGQVADKIMADTGDFSSHDVQPLAGQADNFKAGRTIPLGAVRYLKPNATFPEIRLRFTPPAGKVYGPEIDEVITAGRDVYDASRGRWQGHSDGAPGTPPFTNPAGIYANRDDGISLGYLDDTCDGIIEAKLTLLNGKVLTAMARVTVGPPAFAADSFAVRTVADELAQMLLGAEVTDPLSPETVADIIRRALESIQLLQTEAQNRGGMAAHDGRLQRAREPIFRPVARAAYPVVRGAHAALLQSLAGLSAPAGTPDLLAAVGALRNMLARLRTFDQVGDLSDAGRQKMPALMRNSDGLHLALTRRQYDTVQKAIDQFGAETLPPSGPEQNMLVLISTLRFAAGLHSGIPLDDGRRLSDLFDDPPLLLDYLRSATAKGPLADTAAGQPLIVPGLPAQSAFMQLISNPNHPMHGPYANIIPNLSKTGIEVVREWIESMPGMV